MDIASASGSVLPPRRSDEVIEVPGTSWFAILLVACLVVAVVLIRRRRGLDRGGAFRSGSTGLGEQDQA